MVGAKMFAFLSQIIQTSLLGIINLVFLASLTVNIPRICQPAAIRLKFLVPHLHSEVCTSIARFPPEHDSSNHHLAKEVEISGQQLDTTILSLGRLGFLPGAGQPTLCLVLDTFGRHCM